MTGVGVEFGFLLMRLTGEDVLTLRRGKIRLAPVIEVGKRTGGYKAPDKFTHYEMRLSVPWYRAPFVARVLRLQVAVQMWTRSDLPDDDYVEWLFPYTTWQRQGWSRFYGVTHEGPEVSMPTIPDGQGIAHAGFWKVTEVPND